jgi:hypothetical protein
MPLRASCRPDAGQCSWRTSPISDALEQQVGIRRDPLCFPQKLRQGREIQMIEFSDRKLLCDFLKQQSMARTSAGRDYRLPQESRFPPDMRGIDCSAHDPSD